MKKKINLNAEFELLSNTELKNLCGGKDLGQDHRFDPGDNPGGGSSILCGSPSDHTCSGHCASGTIGDSKLNYRCKSMGMNNAGQRGCSCEPSGTP